MDFKVGDEVIIVNEMDRWCGVKGKVVVVGSSLVQIYWDVANTEYKRQTYVLSGDFSWMRKLTKLEKALK